MKHALLGFVIAACGSTPTRSPASAASPSEAHTAASIAADGARADRTTFVEFLVGYWQEDHARLWAYRADRSVVLVRLAEAPSLLIIQNGLWFTIQEEIILDGTPPPHRDRLSATLIAQHTHECDEESLSPSEVRFACKHHPERPPPKPVTASSTPDEILSATTPPAAIVTPVAYRRVGETLVDISQPDAPRSARRSTGIPAPDVEVIDRTAQLFDDAPGTMTPTASRLDDTGTIAVVAGTWAPSPGTRLAPGHYTRIWRRSEAGWTRVAQSPARRVP